MFYFPTRLVVVLGLLTVACSPGLNWRDVRPTKAPLQALFPCKPEEAERRLPIGEQTVLMRMLACEADGATFTLAYADINQAPRLGEVLEVWRTATLRQAKAAPTTGVPFLPKGALGLSQSTKVVARGEKPDGSAVTIHAVWFAQGSTVFQAAVYSSSRSADTHLSAADTYFSGLKLP